MRPLSRRLVITAALLLTAPAVAGCGDQSATGRPSARSTATSTPTATPTPAPAPAPTRSPASHPPAPAEVIAPELDEGLVRAGRAFVSMARGARGAGLPVDTPVTVLLGGTPAGDIAAADATTPEPWSRLCDERGEGYAQRACPLSALLPLTETGSVTFSADPAREPCSRPHGLSPRDVGGTQRVTLLPRPHASCLDYAAVELYVNDVGQLVAVNLVLGSP